MFDARRVAVGVALCLFSKRATGYSVTMGRCIENHQSGPHGLWPEALSVRELSDVATPGAVVIVAGRLKMADPLQPNIHAVADAARQLFLAHGYDDERITYLATDATREGFDGQPTTANLQAAITAWAASKVGPDRPFTLYMVDHGNHDQFYLDKPSGQWLEPQVLNTWLTQLETAAPGAKVNIVVEACLSGSFIDLVQTVSKPGRVVMTSTGNWNNAHASPDGAIFSDYLLAALQGNESLYSAFQIARSATWIAYPVQTPWLDDNGNGIPNEVSDGQEAQLRGFAYVGTLAGEQWPPYIVQASGPDQITQGNGVLHATVLDDEQVKRVWAVVYPPTYQPPAPGEEMVPEILLRGAAQPGQTSSRQPIPASKLGCTGWWFTRRTIKDWWRVR